MKLKKKILNDASGKLCTHFDYISALVSPDEIKITIFLDMTSCRLTQLPKFRGKD